MSYSPEYQRQRRAERLEKGLCVDCGKEPFLPGKKRCATCNTKNNANARKRRKKLKLLGICASCGKNPPEAGTPTCAACKKQTSQATRRRVYRLRSVGLCQICGKEPPSEGTMICPACARRNAKLSAASYRRKSLKTKLDAVEKDLQALTLVQDTVIKKFKKYLAKSRIRRADINEALVLVRKLGNGIDGLLQQVIAIKKDLGQSTKMPQLAAVHNREALEDCVYWAARTMKYKLVL